LASASGELLQLWLHCSSATAYQQKQLSKLNAAVSSVAFLAAVATGIAAIWRSKEVLQQWRAASGDASAAATASPQRARGTAARGGSAAPHTAAAGRARQSTLRVDQQADVAEARISVTTVRVSVGAAKMLGLQLFLFMNRREDQHLPGSGAAHDLQWVLLMYIALLVGKLHQQQQGISPVQLHTQPATYTSSSSNTSAGSSSGKKGSSKKAARAQQASSSSARSDQSAGQHGATPPPAGAAGSRGTCSQTDGIC
jgi:hypothetical protein